MVCVVRNNRNITKIQPYWFDILLAAKNFKRKYTNNLNQGMDNYKQLKR